MPIRSKNTVFSVLLTVFVLSGCVSASHQRKDVQDDSGDKVTVGTVQKEIRKGMSGAEVAGALGSPNIVSTDEKGWEVWIYDKIATDRVYSHSDAGIKFLTSGSSGASSTSQKTLTVIIKYDQDKKVREFAYHTTRF
jgi:outer membrane protein assembly factor BamE (lipoprotein component of BamABCDE complex)